MRLFARKADPPPPPALPPGQRVYAIGDIHGRLDLLDALLAAIERDSADRGPARVLVLLLGDLIDRGPDSMGVVARAMAPLGWAEFRALKGNHEAAMLDAIDGDRRMLGVWLRNGGDAACRSWGVPEAALAESAETLVAAIEARLPREQRRWLAQLPLAMRIGDYHFVHAGVRPGVPLDRQEDEDALWIRDPFLGSDRDHGAMIVHGHSIATEVEERTNRIGIDTGAYATGRLTALGLEGTARWTLATG